MSSVRAVRLTAVDLFAGAGGATQGLSDAGFTVIAAIENDPAAAASYRLNHSGVDLQVADIRKVRATRLRDKLQIAKRDLTLLKACPPCQGFSSLAEGRSEADQYQNDLVNHVVRFARAFLPAAVLVENVPGLGRDARAKNLITALSKLGYICRQYRVNALDFDVPQRRKRVIILALRGRRRTLPESLSGSGLEGAIGLAPTVRTAFDELAAVVGNDDPLNQARKLTRLVEERIKAIPEGGTRFDLPEHLQLDCHKRLDKSARNATASYGRLLWDQPAPTLTTRCTTPACGAFVHPVKHRGITLREAAMLQTFPYDYQFAGNYGQIERQIGNAVPVRMVTRMSALVLSLIAAPPTAKST